MQKNKVKNYPVPVIVDVVKKYTVEKIDFVKIKSQIILNLRCQNAQITSIWNLGFGILAKDTNYNLKFEIWNFDIWDFGIWILNLSSSACNALDLKKRSDSDYVAFEFRVKKISAAGIDNDILREIHKFPFPIKKLIVSEILSVESRIEKGKDLPGLMSFECQCLFFCKYMLPVNIFFMNKYMVQGNCLQLMFGNSFKTFDESGFEIYEHCELINFEILEKNENDRAENRKLTVNELMERTRNEENGDEKEKRKFLERLKTCLDPILKKNN
ncbi:hypothetical protein Glove_335g24 [Diversispora epigaea]|uniref:Uncharacterized protein n=1 Tax=Diversispora epigaea TaxID=1348612 RepID=A0A397HL96_9GLOM|nr:hypothetical protein Glove_335g24 [Diversispora epigaea]